jgi:hypothetical protein
MLGRRWRAETRAECHGIPISDETLRRGLPVRGVEHVTRRKRPHRAWRARKAPVGERVPLDGSHHDGVEGRGARCVLTADIEDASSRVYARFSAYAGNPPGGWTASCTPGGGMGVRWPAMRTHIRPIKRRPPMVDEPLAGGKPTSHCGRALSERGTS